MKLKSKNKILVALTKREYFAASAMRGLGASGEDIYDGTKDCFQKKAARLAVAMADELILELKMRKRHAKKKV